MKTSVSRRTVVQALSAGAALGSFGAVLLPSLMRGAL